MSIYIKFNLISGFFLRKNFYFEILANLSLNNCLVNCRLWEVSKTANWFIFLSSVRKSGLKYQFLFEFQLFLKEQEIKRNVYIVQVHYVVQNQPANKNQNKYTIKEKKPHTNKNKNKTKQSNKTNKQKE